MSVRQEIRDQQKKLKGQGFKAHLEYFWDYYKIHTFVAIFVVILLSVLIHDISNNKPYGFYAIMLNSGSVGAQDYLEENFAAYSGIDTKEYSCYIDFSSSYDLNLITQTTVATSQKIMANMAGKDLDLLAANEDIFLHYANQESFSDLRCVLSSEQIAKYQDLFVYVDQAYLEYLNSDEYQTYISTGEFDSSNKYAVMADNYNKNMEYPSTDPTTMENPIPVGIDLSGSKLLADVGAYHGTTPVAGIIINTTRPELAAKFIDYILSE